MIIFMGVFLTVSNFKDKAAAKKLPASYDYDTEIQCESGHLDKVTPSLHHFIRGFAA
eukprot:CAMPEP_0202462620 /NCGR_PEP_ID=MMETSP1360-20130828/54743_1 /ASSEMBLY_ACC=CAM_ASM_000848 /TAXON_ID=515479 /ORGANISM="Licmophora paradoxa, Strain CCMP2313" /LENGTH=56 /DNA_ID=CAMNT_0049085167 /DNA_START=85 /DNA_END=251 /DNA_ORIENTATION=+